MATVRIVPALQPLEDRHPRLGLAAESSPVEHFALEGGEEALGHATGAGSGDAQKRLYSGKHLLEHGEGHYKQGENAARILASRLGIYAVVAVIHPGR